MAPSQCWGLGLYVGVGLKNAVDRQSRIGNLPTVFSHIYTICHCIPLHGAVVPKKGSIM